uniref:XK-related protein n=1 Tax=Daphnia galeata TaxID=27404 RepID=A0A8J2SA21_9CRUS|nr:unnamed protein product [Daphnia galeata]
MGQKRRSRTTLPHREESSQIEIKIKDFAERLNDLITCGYLIKFLSITVFSFLCYVATWFYDIYLISYYVIHKDYWYSFFVVACGVNTALCIGITSYRLYNQHGGKIIPRNLLLSESFHSIALTWVFHVVFMGLFPRYAFTIYYAFKGKYGTNAEKKKTNFVAMFWEYAELLKLNQSFCFMKSAAQLTLSLYIILTNKANFEGSSIILPTFSVIGLSLALVSYDNHIRFMRGTEQDAESSGITIDYDMNPTAINYIINTNWKKMARQFFAHFFWIVSRLIALTMFAIGYGWIIFPIVSIHMAGVFIWHKKNNYGHLDSLRFSFLHIFAYLYPLENESDKRKHPRISPAWYQSVSIVVNIVLMLMWTFHVSFGFSSDLSYPWNELTFFVLIWTAPLTTMSLSYYLFWWLNEKRQDNITN